jgi:hypothetical protein
MPLDMSQVPGPVKREESANYASTHAKAIQWQELKQGGFIDKLLRLRRAKVPGGWFVVLGTTGWFYPDPEHQ